MARIAGINIPPHQHAEIGLTAIFGIGRTRARKICEAANVPLSKKVKDLTDAELERIREHVGVFSVEGDLRRERSEEHTSELQSLMRISYAVFCLKKKNTAQSHTLRPMLMHHTTTIYII